MRFFSEGLPIWPAEDLFSSRMMSMHSSTHSSQINTVGPAMSLRTSCWFLPQNEQSSSFLVSLLLTVLISEHRQGTSHHSRTPPNQPHTRSRGSSTRRRERRRRPAESIITKASENPRPPRVLHLPYRPSLAPAPAP